jgi:hypothetical protein
MYVETRHTLTRGLEPGTAFNPSFDYKGRRCTTHHARSSLPAGSTRLIIVWNLPLRIEQNIDGALDTSKCSTSLMPSTYNSPPRIFASLYHTLDVGFEHARCWEDELEKKETWKRHSEPDCLQPHIFCDGHKGGVPYTMPACLYSYKAH